MTTKRTRKVVSRPTIETVGEAAAELARLYEVLEVAAVDLTSDYLNQRLAGKKGETWAMFPKFGPMSRKTPILDEIVCHEGVILLKAGYNLLLDLLYEYCLEEVSMQVPGDNGTSVEKNVISVYRTKVGFDPGSRYVVDGDRVFKAGYDHHHSMPTVGGDGRLAWSPPRDWVNNTLHPVVEIDPELQRVVGALRGFEPVK